ncbi:MAG: hypothetical protein IJT84_03605 [Clostridia bacterium]|nr:hypothetical protein [Clostridia bacterium]
MNYNIQHLFSNIPVPFVVLVLIIAAVISWHTLLKRYLKNYFENMCPKCKKSNAMRFCGTSGRSKTPGSRLETHPIKDNKGNVIGNSQQRVYGTTTSWYDEYECIYCGHKKKKFESYFSAGR